MQRAITERKELLRNAKGYNGTERAITERKELLRNAEDYSERKELFKTQRIVSKELSGY